MIKLIRRRSFHLAVLLFLISCYYFNLSEKHIAQKFSEIGLPILDDFLFNLLPEFELFEAYAAMTILFAATLLFHFIKRQPDEIPYLLFIVSIVIFLEGVIFLMTPHTFTIPLLGIFTTAVLLMSDPKKRRAGLLILALMVFVLTLGRISYSLDILLSCGLGYGVYLYCNWHCTRTWWSREMKYLEGISNV